MKENSYAKINIALNVVKKTANNYHELDMANLCVKLKDTLTYKFNKSGIITINSNVKDLPNDEKNLVMKICLKVKEQFNLDFGCDITINKNIPICAGLGGGSGNAAATLNVLNKKFKLEMNNVQLVNFIKNISSDAPFHLYSLPARVRGFGENIKPFDCKVKGKIFLVKPRKSNSTKDVYESLDYERLTHPNINKVIRALKENNISLLAKHVGNSLLDSACKLTPEIAEIIVKLHECGFEVVGMSGSGTTCFAYSTKKEAYQNASKKFNPSNYDLCKSFGIYNKY